MLASDRVINIFRMTNRKYFDSLFLAFKLLLLADFSLVTQPVISEITRQSMFRENLQTTATKSNLAQNISESQVIIYVDPQRGDDSQLGNSQNTPLKTITKALEIAESGTTIKLASGTYSEATGEIFPLIIKQNVTIKGSPGSRGHNIVIEGNGYFISPTGAGQNVAIAASKDAGGITGVTVINPHNRGHGLWIESANPAIIGNTFTRNGNTGISVNGNSSPLIEDNYFYNNGGNGLLVYGTSQAEVKNNVFEKTGFGVSAVQNTSLLLTDNEFKGNRIGIILEEESQGILRNNSIENSLESGLTAIAQSRVDLGSNDQPGNNIFSRNSKFDIQNASSNEIVAVGTEINGKTAGQINFNDGEGLSFVANNNNDNSRPLPPLLSVDKAPKNNPLRRDNPLFNPPSLNENSVATSSSLPKTNTNQEELVFTTPAVSQPVPFPPETNSNESLPSPPAVVLNPNLSQPSPLNYTYGRRIDSLSDVLGSSSSPTIRYKVLVETKNEHQKRQVRSLYPEAFPTVYQGRMALQVGAFSNWGKAQRARRNLEDLGLNSHILE